MCGLLTLLLIFIGGFGFFSVVPGAVVESPAPDIEVEIRPTALLMTPTPTPFAPPNEVISICPPPAESDFQVVAEIERGMFGAPTWALSQSDLPDRSRYTWVANALGGLAMIELLRYDCGYDQADVDAYYSGGDAWDVIFSSYESYEYTAVCVEGDVVLHEFDAVVGGYNYTIRYWVDPVSDQRLATVMLVFPEWEADEMRRYARRLYPDLVSCEEGVPL